MLNPLATLVDLVPPICICSQSIRLTYTLAKEIKALVGKSIYNLFRNFLRKKIKFFLLTILREDKIGEIFCFNNNIIIQILNP